MPWLTLGLRHGAAHATRCTSYARERRMEPVFKRASAVSLGIVAALVITAGANSAAGAAPGDRPTAPPVLTAAACAPLADLVVAARDIGLPTRGAEIDTAVWDAAGNYCAVTGWVRAVTAPQDMQFRVNLPANWNGRT